MKERIVKKWKERKGRLMRGTLILLFAVLLTAGAVIGEQETRGANPTTGKDTSTPGRDLKFSGGGGDISSDFQGVYFYVQPASSRELGMNLAEEFFGSNAKGGYYPDAKSIRELMGEMDYQEIIEMDASDLRWNIMYQGFRNREMTICPPQKYSASLFVAEEYCPGSFESFLKDWKENQSTLFYKEAPDSDGYSVLKPGNRDAEAAMKNRIFMYSSPSASRKGGYDIRPKYKKTTGDIKKAYQQGVYYTMSPIFDW